MEDIERIKEHLQNVQSVEPIITSIRTIAAGGWRLARRRLEATSAFVDHLSQALSAALAVAPPTAFEQRFLTRDIPSLERVAVVVIAAERGLCGAFNDLVLSGADRLLAQQQLESDEILLVTVGRRAEQHFHRQGRDIHLAQSLPVTRVASYDLIRGLGQTLLNLLLEQRIDGVLVIYSPYSSTATQAPILQRWLPVDVSILPPSSVSWPPPLMEGDYDTMLQRLLWEWMFASLFQYVMESAASEQSARFRAMDAASTNLDKIIDELTLNYHSARQHAITMEMLDLAAGSGILKRRGQRTSGPG